MKIDLYEYMPTLYVVAGVITGLIFDNSIGRYSASLLIIAGTLVFNMRIANRSK